MIDAMEAGPEIDAAVAEIIFKWERATEYGPPGLLVPPEGDPRRAWCAKWDTDGLPNWLPDFSADPAAAHEVIEKMGELGWWPYMKKPAAGMGDLEHWQVRFYSKTEMGRCGTGVSKTFAEAVCKAALRAVSHA